MEYEISYSCVSNIGLRRRMNQDNFICGGVHRQNEAGTEPTYPITGTVSSTQNALFGVFDGMGGEARGEMASLLAAKRAANTDLNKPAADALSEICTAANQDICDFSKQYCLSACGTTAAMLMFGPEGVTACNIGDSKIFRLTDGTLQQISRDHLSIAPYGCKPPLSQYLGIPPDEMYISPYITAQEYRAADSYLICSDGLSDMVEPEKIYEILLSNEAGAASRKLLELALAGGGKDNITLIAFKLHTKRNGFSGFVNRLFKGGHYDI